MVDPVTDPPTPELEISPELEGQRVFITGGAGFIGSTLAGVLLPGNQVVVFDDLSRDSLKDKPYASHPNLQVIKGSVLDTDALREAIGGATYVVHCAGIAGIDTVVKQPVHTMQVNMIGSANVLEAAARLPDIKRVVCF